MKDDYKLPEKQYDFICLISVIEHLHPENLEVLFADIETKLAPGGSLFVVVPNVNSLMMLLKGKKKEIKRQVKDCGHVNLMERREIVSLLNKHGFTKLRFSHFMHYKDTKLIPYPGIKRLGVLKYLYDLMGFFPFYYVRNSFWILARR